MTIDKAIETQQYHMEHPYIQALPELQKAMKISNEAMRTVQNIRKQNYGMHIPPLPGETKQPCAYCGVAHASIDCPSREGEK